MSLKKHAQEALAHRRQLIKEFSELQPEHPFAVANRHMLELDTGETWGATGVLSMTGALWWALNLSVDLAFPNSVIFNATGGPDLSFGVFTSVVTGYFMVDPATLGGEYRFTMQALSGGLGEVSFDLYTLNWSQIASFQGVAAGISATFNLTGTGKLTYH